MPTNFKEAVINPTNDDIIEVAVKCTFYGERKIGTFKVLNFDDIKQILESVI